MRALFYARVLAPRFLHECMSLCAWAVLAWYYGAKCMVDDWLQRCSPVTCTLRYGDASQMAGLRCFSQNMNHGFFLLSLDHVFVAMPSTTTRSGDLKSVLNAERLLLLFSHHLLTDSHHLPPILATFVSQFCARVVYHQAFLLLYKRATCSDAHVLKHVTRYSMF